MTGGRVLTMKEVEDIRSRFPEGCYPYPVMDVLDTCIHALKVVEAAKEFYEDMAWSDRICISYERMEKALKPFAEQREGMK